jgi:hypothetical protein
VLFEVDLGSPGDCIEPPCVTRPRRSTSALFERLSHARPSRRSNGFSQTTNEIFFNLADPLAAEFESPSDCLQRRNGVRSREHPRGPDLGIPAVKCRRELQEIERSQVLKVNSFGNDFPLGLEPTAKPRLQCHSRLARAPAMVVQVSELKRALVHVHHVRSFLSDAGVLVMCEAGAGFERRVTRPLLAVRGLRAASTASSRASALWNGPRRPFARSSAALAVLREGSSPSIGRAQGMMVHATRGTSRSKAPLDPTTAASSNFNPL